MSDGMTILHQRAAAAQEELNAAKKAIAEARPLDESCYGPWDSFASCPGCGEHYRALRGKVFFLNFECCPHCGERKTEGWKISIMRWVNPVHLFRPSTWKLDGFWETK